MHVKFRNVESAFIKNCFSNVLNQYKRLHPHEVQLIQKRIKASTMQAQPVLTVSSFFSSVKRYKIQLGKFVRDSEELKVNDLPEKVLTGWFAHELGHLVDYERRSNWRMLIYGLKYLISADFRRKTEHEADYIAIEHGFHDEIIATKKYILEHDLLEEKYKAKIRKYYLSIEDVEMCIKEKTPVKPEVVI